ncbi:MULTISPECIES: lytic polysaccharide monooxygenase [unclassified Pseudomonas]|uniref:Lytic polysaccharide monooxygenase n=1 Tax=Pseudomonas sp. MYb327 TaxID=2745230 RepID=A0AAU8E9T5_9PSED
MSQRNPNTISRSSTPRHGHVFSPASRAYFAWQDGDLDEGALNQREAGKFFPETSGGLKDPFAADDVLSAEPPPDGKIASAGQLTGAFLDQPGDHWKKHEVLGGESLPVSWNFTANHPARRWDYFITEADWDSSKPLARNQFGAKPFYTVQNNLQPFWQYPNELKPRSPTTHEVPLPNREGYHVLLAAYVVADTGMAFYQVVDLNFAPPDGGGERPETPTGLTASNVTDKQVMLTWNEASGSHPIAFYRMTRNGITTVDIDAPLMTWIDHAVTPGTLYNYFISAVDELGNVSRPSPAIEARTLPENGAPGAPSNLHSMRQTETSISLMWAASSGPQPISHYLIFRNDQEVQRVGADVSSFEDTDLTPNSEYSYFVKALDSSGKLSVSSNVLTVKTHGGAGEYPVWKLGTQYAKNDVVKHAGQNWACLQAHTSYVEEWAPGVGDNVLWKEHV